MQNVGIIGCGVIGSEIAKHVSTKLNNVAKIKAVCDVDDKQLNAFILRFGIDTIEVMESYDKLISEVDIVVESANGKISADIAKKALTAGKDVIILSVGGLLEHYDEIKQLEQILDAGNIYIPSGAVAGIDCLTAASIESIESVQITTRKPPKGLVGAPYLVEKGISLNNLGDKELTVFEGSARDAVKAFPKNINVSALLSIAGFGPDKTRVKILTSEKFTKNMHEVTVKGDFGEMTAITKNEPSPANPKTSYLAALSACAMISKIVSKIKIGT